ncbi:MAG: Na-translocating system protein MpsC family protein [Desulfatirhabdiaceae bacterium]|nr:Na-translocating system protein MpsC family protein [Desulfatirhabdiaceae bacterium]
MGKTKGQIEAEICEAAIKFKKEYIGRSPVSLKSSGGLFYLKER